MKNAVLLFSIALLALASAAMADPRVQAPAPTVQAAPSALPAATAPDPAADLALAKLFSAQKPVDRSTSCYDTVYEYCQSFCYDLNQNNRCDFFASQECLCERYPADCPLCY